AASAMSAGSVPAICTLIGSGSPTWSIRVSDLRVFQKRGSLVVISDTANPAPSCLHSSRNGLSVTPAIGARTTFGSMACGPMRMQALSQQRRTHASERPASGARMDMTSLDPRLRGDDGEEGAEAIFREGD